MSFPFSFNPNILATRKRKVFGEEDNINPDNIDFSTAMQPPVGQQGGGHPMLGNILQAIASGVGIGFSQDPAQALISQLAQQRQQQMEQAKMAEDRRRQQIQNESAKELEGIRQRGQEKIVGMEQVGRKELQANEIGAQKELKTLGFGNEQKMQQAQIDAQKNLELMRQDYELSKMYDSEDFAKEIEALKNSGDIRQAQSKTLMASLFHAMQNSRYVKGAPIPPSAVISITDKVGKGEPLTKEETGVIDRAFKASAAANAAAARHSGSGGGGKEGKKDTQLQRQSQLDWEKNRRDLVTSVMTGSRVPLTDNQGQQVKDINGNVQMVQASGPDLVNKINEALSIHDAVNPQPFSARTAHPVNTNQGSNNGGQEDAALNRQVDGLVEAGKSINEINQMVDSSNMNPAQKRQAKARVSQLSSKLKGQQRF